MPAALAVTRLAASPADGDAPAWTQLKFPPLDADVCAAHVGIYPYCIGCAAHLYGIDILQQAAAAHPDEQIRTSEHQLLVEIHRAKPGQPTGLIDCHCCRRALTPAAGPELRA